VLLRAAIVAILLLGSSTATAEPALRPVKAVKSRAPAKKKAPAPRANASANHGPTPLTAEELGLGDIKLSSIQSDKDEPPPPAAPPPEPVPAAPPPPPPPAPKLELANKDKVIAPRDAAPRRLSIEINPIPIVGGRYGGNVEVALARHHVLVGSGYYQTFEPRVLEVIMPKAVDTSHGAQARIGGEFGYRFYSGRRGANGFFAGASAVAMPLALPRVLPDFKTDVPSFYGFGGAVDVGIQAITDAGFTIGGGIGGMYLAYDAPKSAQTPPGAPPIKYYEPHFLPRVLLAAGWSF
jgi:hypothetical protein